MSAAGRSAVRPRTGSAGGPPSALREADPVPRGRTTRAGISIGLSGPRLIARRVPSGERTQVGTSIAPSSRSKSNRVNSGPLPFKRRYQFLLRCKLLRQLFSNTEPALRIQKNVAKAILGLDRQCRSRHEVQGQLVHCPTGVEKMKVILATLDFSSTPFFSKMIFLPLR